MGTILTGCINTINYSNSKTEPRRHSRSILDSTKAIGIDTSIHDIRFVGDNWESPTLGAWGWAGKLWLDGMEITQFTYFQQVGGVHGPESGEVNVRFRANAMYIQDVDNVYDIRWNKT